MKIDEVTTGDYLVGMRSVGVKQLKARLSEYLRAVRAGEIVLVTDRDQVVAELRPAREFQAPAPSEDTLQALADSGEVTRAQQVKGDWTWKAQGMGMKEGTTEALLDELRADGGSD